MGMRVSPTDAPRRPPRGRASDRGALRRVVMWGVVCLSVLWWVGSVVSSLGDLRASASWLILSGANVAVAVAVAALRPDHPSAPWVVAIPGLYAISELSVVGLDAALASGADQSMIALWNTIAQVLGVISSIALARVVGLFASGVAGHRWESRALAALWGLLVVPVVTLLMCAQIVLPSWMAVDASVSNPFFLGVVSIAPSTALVLQEQAGSAAVIVGVVVLVIRYLRGGDAVRRPMRWLLVPVALLPFPIVATVLAQLGGDGPDWIVAVSSVAVSMSFAGAIAIGILRPAIANPDKILRRTLIYGLLWIAIAVLFLALGALVGTAAGTLVSVEWAVVIAMIAAIVFQPLRRRLEQLADRWIFGAKPDPSRVVVALGDALAETDDLDALLPRIASTLEDGLALQWARVRIASAEDAETRERDPRASLVIPIEVDGEHVGLLECGPKISGDLRPSEIAMVETFARQAGMALRNVLLKQRLADKAAELRESRGRLVRAQEIERRRIERNIHDGVQQDLAALIGLAGHARQDLARQTGSVADDLEMMQEGLGRILADVRALAQGIHPSVLSDRGLLAAVEALAARHPIPVSVRADRMLRDARLPEELEGAAYFTVAEALANSLKHASAQHIDVELALRRHALRVIAWDDGVGFETRTSAGTGLANLAERVAAVGGTLEVAAEPGCGTRLAADFALSVGDEPS